MRAQVRQRSQQGSGDWSDASRDNSVAPSQSDTFEAEKGSVTQIYAYDSPGRGDAPYLTNSVSHPPYFGSTSEGMAYTHPDLANWTFGHHGMEGHAPDQTYAYPAGPSYSREAYHPKRRKAKLT